VSIQCSFTSVVPIEAQKQQTKHAITEKCDNDTKPTKEFEKETKQVEIGPT